MNGKIVLENVSSHREQWLEMRRNKITGTAITAIAGINPYKSALQLWAEWTGKVDSKFEGNEYTDLGIALEPYVGSLYARRTGRGVRYIDALYQHKDLEWALATPDFVVDESELLEVKTGTIRQLEYWQDENTPEHHAVQLQWQMGVLGIEKGHVGALIGGDPSNFLVRSFDLNYEIFNVLLELGFEFLDLVKKDEPPNPGPGDSKLIAKLVQRNNSAKLFTAETADVLGPYFDELIELRERKGELDAEVRKIEAQIKLNENTLKLAAAESSEAAFADGRRYRIKKIECGEKTIPGYSYERLYILQKGGA
jgi:putative phage-type endonuclease